ncbi:hypothetical protein L208DRAFT_1333898 [Tricholoma matsutake]|nr:hypothetical protein L208DRAFT_1333898 [Tricholoma matsutake 945]
MTTPHKRGVAAASNATLDKMLPRLREDTDGKLFEGAVIERFVEHAWGVPCEDISHILSSEWSLDAESLDEYESADFEPKMYKPFSKIADALTKNVRDSLKKGESPMKFWNRDGTYVIKNLFSSRKPDMLSVLKDANLPFWPMIYVIIEFKKKRSYNGSSGKASSQSSSSLAGIPEHASTAPSGSSKVSSNGSPRSRSRAQSFKNQLESTSKTKKAKPSMTSSRLAVSLGTVVHKSSRTAKNTTPSETTSGPSSAQHSNKRKFAGTHNDTGSKRVRSSESTASRITNDQMQLATYALEAMAVSTRHYTTAVFIDKFVVSLWYYDRACVIRTVNFDFRKEPAKLALVLYAMSNCSRSYAGFDPFLLPNPTAAPSSASGPLTKTIGAHFVFPPDGREISVDSTSDVRFCIKEILSEYRGLIGRGTMVYHVSRIHEDGRLEDGQVIKSSWPLVLRTREATTIATLLQAIPEWKDHLPEVHFSSTYTAKQLGLPRFKLLKSHSEKDKLEDRELHVLAMSLYKKMWEVDSVEEFQDIFVDCVECHYHAYATAKVLHRDLSENNLMFKYREDCALGIVNDWDMASHLNATGEVPTSTARHRTGTVPFMARDLLVDEPPVHLYRHDLESFFYILVWAAVHFDIQNKMRLPTHAALRVWDDDSLKIAHYAKSTLFLTYEGAFSHVFRHVRGEFSNVLDNWILPLWDLFREAIHSIPRPGRAGDYDKDTLGGRITFHTFMTALGRVPRQPEDRRTER